VAEPTHHGRVLRVLSMIFSYPELTLIEFHDLEAGLIAVGMRMIGPQLPAIPAARVKILCDPIVSSVRQPVSGFSPVSIHFFETELLRSGLHRNSPSCARRNFPPTTRCRLTRLHRSTQENQGGLGRINRKERGGLFPTIPEGLEQVPHGVQRVIIEEGSHPLP
jgi:hypothetical protein